MYINSAQLLEAAVLWLTFNSFTKLWKVIIESLIAKHMKFAQLANFLTYSLNTFMYNSTYKFLHFPVQNSWIKVYCLPFTDNPFLSLLETFLVQNVFVALLCGFCVQCWVSAFILSVNSCCVWFIMSSHEFDENTHLGHKSATSNFSLIHRLP